jgi:hypothetical protein
MVDRSQCSQSKSVKPPYIQAIADMLNIDPDPAREKLGFKDAVLSSFKFLRDLRFRPVQREMTFVRYESSKVFVNVYHGRASFEMGVEIGRLSQADERLTLSSIVALAGAEKAEGFGRHVMFQVSSREGVQQFVPKLAALVQKYGPPFLRGDDDAYCEALKARALAWAQYQKQVTIDQSREKAEPAWHAKDYVRVVELYQAMREDLTQVEAKRLAYAERRLLPADAAVQRPVSKQKQ